MADCGFRCDGQPLDSGKFRQRFATWRCPPYMCDGRFFTLEQVIDHYNTGGLPSSTLDPFMKSEAGGLAHCPKEALDALHTLDVFVNNPKFQDPH